MKHKSQCLRVVLVELIAKATPWIDNTNGLHAAARCDLADTRTGILIADNNGSYNLARMQVQWQHIHLRFLSALFSRCLLQYIHIIDCKTWIIYKKWRYKRVIAVSYYYLWIRTSKNVTPVYPRAIYLVGVQECCAKFPI